MADVTGRLGGVYQLIDGDGHRHLAITLGQVPTTTRLARRGANLVVLVPEVARHRTDTRSQCECDRGPVILSMSGHVNLGLAFIVDVLPSPAIERLTVPVVEDYIEWECKRLLVKGETHGSGKTMPTRAMSPSSLTESERTS